MQTLFPPSSPKPVSNRQNTYPYTQRTYKIYIIVKSNNNMAEDTPIPPKIENKSEDKGTDPGYLVFSFVVRFYLTISLERFSI